MSTIVDPQIPTPDAAQGKQRQSIRLKGYDYSQAGGFYVTIVTFRRQFLFGEIVNGEMQVNALGRIVQECWGDIPVHFQNVEVDAFVIMPNHVHEIIFIHEDDPADADARRSTIYRAPTSLHNSALSVEQFGKPSTGSLSTIVRTFKAAVTRRAGRELNSGNIWQRNYYEHILRNQVDYELKAGTILANPSHWEKDEEYPGNESSYHH